MEPIRWGIMGAGRMAGWFATALQKAENAACYAVASRTKDKAEAFAAEYGFQKAYASYEELLQDKQVDVVYIATPIRHHFACMEACIAAGKHIFCEKAFAVNSRQAKVILDKAERAGLFVGEAMWMKYQPVYLAVRKAVQSGMIGEIKAIDGRFYTKGDASHRLYNKDIAGGALLDLGVYPIQYATALLGAPKAIYSHANLCSAGVDAQNSIVLEYDGAYAHLSSGITTEKKVSMAIYGTKGKVVIDDEFFFQATHAAVLDLNHQPLAEFREPFLANGYEYEAMAVSRCLQEGRLETPEHTRQEILLNLEVMDACRSQWGLHFDFE